MDVITMSKFPFSQMTIDQKQVCTSVYYSLTIYLIVIWPIGIWHSVLGHIYGCYEIGQMPFGQMSIDPKLNVMGNLSSI
jgi:hypothetical protein